MRLNVDTGVIASGASPPRSLSLWQGVICDLGMCVIRAMGWSLRAARLPCVPDPRPISRDRDLAHRPWPGSITFHRCADGPERGTGDMPYQVALCFWENHFHPLRFIFSSIR